MNNVYYRNVSIDHDVLALLPDDGHLSGLVTMAVESDELEPPAAHQDIYHHKIPLLPVHLFQCLLLVEQSSRLLDSLYSSTHVHHLCFHGHHQVVHLSMSSLLRATCLVHSPPSFPLVQLTL